MDYTIRKCIISDCKEIFELVKELALFENCPDDVWTSPEKFEKGFREKLFDCLIAKTAERKLVGMALYYDAWSTWKGKMYYLEDFVVKEGYRNKGIGQKLFDRFLQEAKIANCALVKWEVLDWNTKAINFYKRNGANIEEGWLDGKIYF